MGVAAIFAERSLDRVGAAQRPEFAHDLAPVLRDSRIDIPLEVEVLESREGAGRSSLLTGGRLRAVACALAGEDDASAQAEGQDGAGQCCQ